MRRVKVMSATNPTTTERYWLCPLFSFRCDSESLDLTNGSRIIKTPEEFKEYIKARDEWQLLIGKTNIPDWLFVLPCGETIENVEYKLITSGAEMLRAFNILVNFAQACRIHRQGSIFPGDLILTLLTDDRWFFGSRLKTYLQKDNRRPNFTKPVYTLKKLDVPKVENLMSLLNTFANLEKHDDIHIALRRFNSAYQGSNEDRIIDQMIAFESLYIGDEQGIKHNLAVRTASLLGESQELRNEIFEDMKDAYKQRCNIVHNTDQVDRKKLWKIIPKTENYLRQSIRKFLELLFAGYSLDDLKREIKKLAKLDENILSNSTLLP